MHRYKVRTHTITNFSFVAQVEHYQDYDLESSEPLEAFAAQLARNGFLEPSGERWIMPGAIIWIEPK